MEELKELADQSYTEAIRRSKVIGYAELLDVLDGNLGLEDAVALIKQNTRRYAKRQLTWFRHQLAGDFFESSAALLHEIERNLP